MLGGQSSWLESSAGILRSSGSTSGSPWRCGGACGVSVNGLSVPILGGHNFPPLARSLRRLALVQGAVPSWAQPGPCAAFANSNTAGPDGSKLKLVGDSGLL